MLRTVYVLSRVKQPQEENKFRFTRGKPIFPSEKLANYLPSRPSSNPLEYEASLTSSLGMLRHQKEPKSMLCPIHPWQGFLSFPRSRSVHLTGGKSQLTSRSFVYNAIRNSHALSEATPNLLHDV